MNQKYLAGGIVICAAVIAIVCLRGNEDEWTCKNGLWEKHGNPGAPMPNSECGDELLPPSDQQFSNGEPYKNFVINEFSMRYPNWKDMPPPAVPPTDIIPISVSKDGCAFMIRVSEIAKGTTFKEYAEAQIGEQQKKISLNILEKTIDDTRGHLDAEFQTGATTLKNLSDTFLIKGNHTVGIAFAGEKTKFERFCAPIISEVLASVKFK